MSLTLYVADGGDDEVGFPYVELCSGCLMEYVWSFAQPRDFCECDAPRFYRPLNESLSPKPTSTYWIITDNGLCKYKGQSGREDNSMTSTSSTSSSTSSTSSSTSSSTLEQYTFQQSSN